MDDNERDQCDPKCDPKQLARIFDKLKNDEVGLPHGDHCNESDSSDEYISIDDEDLNVESSHETASSGGVQGGLGRGLTVMPPSVDGTPMSISPARPVSEVDGTKNVEGSHETASSGGVQGGLGRGLTVTPPSCEEGCEKCAELDVLAWFVDRFITCTLKDPSTRKVALQVQQHKHFPQSCRKRGTDCRYGAPWFPAIRTIIQVPARLKFKLGEDELENEKIKEREKEAEKVQSAVKGVLEDEEFIEYAQS